MIDTKKGVKFQQHTIYDLKKEGLTTLEIIPSFINLFLINSKELLKLL